MTILNIEMDTMCCIECGIHYNVPADWLDARYRDGGEFFCPNGHQMHADPKPADTKPADVVPRSELIQAMHRAEQAEAKAAEASARRRGKAATT